MALATAPSRRSLSRAESRAYRELRSIGRVRNMLDPLADGEGWDVVNTLFHAACERHGETLRALGARDGRQHLAVTAAAEAEADEAEARAAWESECDLIALVAAARLNARHEADLLDLSSDAEPF
jgi:hypothetical protein